VGKSQENTKRREARIVPQDCRHTAIDLRTSSSIALRLLHYHITWHLSINVSNSHLLSHFHPSANFSLCGDTWEPHRPVIEFAVW